jgi:hypothetical protein
MTIEGLGPTGGGLTTENEMSDEARAVIEAWESLPDSGNSPLYGYEAEIIAMAVLAVVERRRQKNESS